MSVVVSVIIPTFNRQELTERAIFSVRTRSPESVEILVVDDAGTVPFRFENPRNQSGVAVRVLRLANNGGPGLARKAGVQVAQGKFVAFLDSDDEFLADWIDAIVDHAISRQSSTSKVMFVGIVKNPPRVAGAIAKVLRILPAPFRIGVARLVSVFFNVYYTPSIAITRESVRFHEKLRHCEDYFMTTVSLFEVKRLVMLDVEACKLGRTPNTLGGESAQRDLMYQGEIAARRAIVQEPKVPIWHKSLYPLGRAYQATRSALKSLLL